MTVPKTPAECGTKQEVREQLDRIDEELVRLFAQRHGFVTRMAQFKSDPHEAFVPERIEEIVAGVRAQAEALQLDEDQAELIWRTLIDWNVNYEKGIIAARQKT